MSEGRRWFTQAGLICRSSGSRLLSKVSQAQTKKGEIMANSDEIQITDKNGKKHHIDHLAGENEDGSVYIVGVKIPDGPDFEMKEIIKGAIKVACKVCKDRAVTKDDHMDLTLRINKTGLSDVDLSYLKGLVSSFDHNPELRMKHYVEGASKITIQLKTLKRHDTDMDWDCLVIRYRRIPGINLLKVADEHDLVAADDHDTTNRCIVSVKPYIVTNLPNPNDRDCELTIYAKCTIVDGSARDEYGQPQRQTETFEFDLDQDPPCLLKNGQPIEVINAAEANQCVLDIVRKLLDETE